MQTWSNVAKLVSVQGMKGRFVARSVRDLPFLLEEGMSVAFVPPTMHGPRHVRVKEVTHLDGDDWLVSFTGVKGRDVAEELVGSFCLVPRDQLREAVDDAEWLEVDCIGFDVVDEELGLVGTLDDVQEMPAQSLMIVSRPDGGEALIPVVDEFLLDIDEDGRVVHVKLPEGLLELD